VSPRDAGRRRPPTLPALVLLLASLVVAGCGLVSTTPPAPTPADFAGIVSEVARRGIEVSHVVSGDPGCPDETLAPTAIRMTLSGLDQTEPVTAYLYIFRNRASYEKLHGEIDSCARSYVTDPETYESIDAYSPFVLAGQGPWGPEFRGALRESLQAAAGSAD